MKRIGRRAAFDRHAEPLLGSVSETLPVAPNVTPTTPGSDSWLSASTESRIVGLCSDGESARRQDRVRRSRGEIEENISTRNVTSKIARFPKARAPSHDSGSPFRPSERPPTLRQNAYVVSGAKRDQIQFRVVIAKGAAS